MIKLQMNNKEFVFKQLDFQAGKTEKRRFYESTGRDQDS